MDDSLSWPALIRRLRFLRSLKQYEFAQELGVDQPTLSRWERGFSQPDCRMQKVLRDKLHALELMIEPAAIESMPMLAMLYCRNEIGLCIASSPAFAEAYCVPARHMRYKMIKDSWSESVKNMWDVLLESDAWKSDDVAFATATLYRPDQKWSKFTLMPLGRENLLFGSGVEAPPPTHLKLNEFDLAIVTKAELVDGRNA